ncbi:MAG: AmmeMemoRadiSam system protein B [Puniceicoccales bacterium]|jgi:AmmeMemoRadiSam system protein B/AmmeMemoRadiSam system protein A|nr:AmmeMemoRadiSam system protein B [Puniceicoccales bacterium]
MPKLKEANVAGLFYPKEPEILLAEISRLKSPIERQYGCSSRALIVPHAGYAYSGKLAVKALQYLDKGVKNVFIFSPAHRLAFDGIAVSDYGGFQTPLGTIPTNNAISGELLAGFGCELLNEAFDNEHAVEVQLPLLKACVGDIQVIPIVVGNAKHGSVARIMEKFWPDKSNAFLISSDLSHFHSHEEAMLLDASSCNAIESCSVEDFRPDYACGATAICGLMNFAAANNFSLIRIGTYNSGEVSGDRARVVGYGAWMLAESCRNKFIKDNFADDIIKICRGSVESSLAGKENFKPGNVPEVLNQLGASFVTLEIGDNLRGCIGSIRARQPLVADLVQNAHSAAFKDPRFPPLTPEEFKNVTVRVSLLSHPQRIAFENEQDLLDAIVPKMDGIIIKDGVFQAVYLPCVWEQLPSKGEFLASLKRKAGLPRDHFSKTFEAFKFSTEYF